MNLALFLPQAPRKEWLIQGEDLWMAGIAAVVTALLMLVFTFILRKKGLKDNPYRKWFVLLASGAAMIVLGMVMYRLNPPPIYILR